MRVSRTVKPPVDVVILSWNRLHLTLQSIDSVLRQVEVDPRIWIVDQGSEDVSLKTLRELASSNPAIQLAECGQNLGVAEGRNIGMASGSAECIVCLDNDAVLLTQTALRHAVSRLEGEPDLAAIGFRILDPQTGRDDESSWGYPRSLLARSDRGFVATRYVGAGHALRRSALERTDGYDTDLFFYWEELDLSYQLIEAGYQIVYDPAIVVEHRASMELRAHWHDVRYYYHVRNAVYLDFKYFGSLPRVAVQSTGYLIKGIYNRVSRQALRGVFDAMRMIGRSVRRKRARLSESTLAYIREHDLRYRGGIRQRLREEVFVLLPGLERSR